MLIFQNQILTALGSYYPQPAIRTAVTVSVLPQLLNLNYPYLNVNANLANQVIYSNPTTANNLITYINQDNNRINSYQSTMRSLEANWNYTYRNSQFYLVTHPWTSTAQAANYRSYIAQAQARIDNYKNQLARLIVYTRPSLPLPATLLSRTVVYGGYATPVNPYYDQYGRALYDTLGRPYFDQFGRPYPYTPYNLYRY